MHLGRDFIFPLLHSEKEVKELGASARGLPLRGASETPRKGPPRTTFELMSRLYRLTDERGAGIGNGLISAEIYRLFPKIHEWFVHGLFVVILAHT